MPLSSLDVALDRKRPMPNELPSAPTAEVEAETIPSTPEPGPQQPDRGRWYYRVPGLVWAITGLHVALMALTSILYPPFSGYDEPQHIDMVWSYYNGDGIYGPGERILDRGIEVAVTGLPSPANPTRSRYGLAAIPPRGERRSFDSLNDGEPTGFRVPNQMVQHPPLYYAGEAALLHLMPGYRNLPFDQQVWLMRLLSILLVAPMPVLAWATARTLTGGGPVPLVAASLPVTVPGLSRVGGSVQNDNLMIVLVGLLTLVMAKVLAGDLRKRTGLAAGVLTGLACLTKGFALVLPVFVTAAYAVAWLRHRRRPVAPWALATVSCAAISAWWWVRNLALYGAVQPSGLGTYWTAQIESQGSRTGGTTGEYIGKFVVRFSYRMWGGIGYPENPKLAVWLTWAWLVLLLAGAALGVAYGLRGRWGHAAAFTFAMPWLMIVGMLFVSAHGSFLENRRLPGIQGRYTYPALVGMAALFAIGVCWVARRHARWLPLGVLAAGLLTQAYAWLLLVTTWWLIPPGTPYRITAWRETGVRILYAAPWPKAVSALPFLVVPVLSVLVLVLAARYAGRARRVVPVADAG
jgi:4-amino-4-deoxy-L-arabinose transferase-like glycosyltransferase